MGQVTRLLRNNLVGGSGTDDVYPITSTTAVIQPGTNKTVEELINAVNKQNDVRSIRSTEIVNSGRTLRFTYTDGDINDVDLPETVKAISVQKNGDTNIMTITGTNGNTQVLNIGSNIEYNVLAADNTITVTKEVDENSNVTFYVKASLPEIPDIPQVNDGMLTIKQGDATLGTFTANQSGNTIVTIPEAQEPEAVDVSLMHTNKARIDKAETELDVIMSNLFDHTPRFMRNEFQGEYRGLELKVENGNVLYRTAVSSLENGGSNISYGGNYRYELSVTTSHEWQPIDSQAYFSTYGTLSIWKLGHFNCIKYNAATDTMDVYSEQVSNDFNRDNLILTGNCYVGADIINGALWNYLNAGRSNSTPSGSSRMPALLDFGATSYGIAVKNLLLFDSQSDYDAFEVRYGERGVITKGGYTYSFSLEGTTGKYYYGFCSITDTNGNKEQLFSVPCLYVGTIFFDVTQDVPKPIGCDFSFDKLKIGDITYDEDFKVAETTTVEVEDKDVTLAYGERSEVAAINNTTIHVTMPDKPTYEGINIEFYDITVSNELEFFKAVAISRGYPITHIKDITEITSENKSYVTAGYAINGVVTPVQVRMHLSKDITLYSCFEYNMTNVTVNGNDFTLKFGSTLTLDGRSANFNNCRIECMASLGNDNYIFNIKGVSGVHTKVTFDKCQFNGSVYQSLGRSNKFIKVASNSGSSSCTLYFYFCTWVTNSGGGDNSTLASSGKVYITFESMGSSNVKIFLNQGIGAVGGHSCKDFYITTNVSNAGEILYDNSVRVSRNSDSNVTALNITADN